MIAIQPGIVIPLKNKTIQLNVHDAMKDEAAHFCILICDRVTDLISSLSPYQDQIPEMEFGLHAVAIDDHIRNLPAQLRWRQCEPQCGRHNKREQYTERSLISERFHS